MLDEKPYGASSNYLSVMTEDQTDYVAQVTERARRLIQMDIWDIPEHRLDTWLGCFSNYSCELLAAFLLDNLCLRSRHQFESLLDTLFCDLPDPLGGEGDRLLSMLARNPKRKPPELLLVPVIGAEQPPTKSGPYVLRLAARRYQIHSAWLAWPAKISGASGLKHVFFVDDFCGSGKQFEEFANSINLTQLHQIEPKVKLTYLVAAAHETGIEHVRKSFPFVSLKVGEILAHQNAIMSDANLARYQVGEFKEEVRRQYDHLIAKAGLPVKGDLRDGFGGLGLAYGFSHGTPNNSLPIFWYDTEYWTPLLDR